MRKLIQLLALTSNTFAESISYYEGLTWENVVASSGWHGDKPADTSSCVIDGNFRFRSGSTECTCKNGCQLTIDLGSRKLIKSVYISTRDSFNASVSATRI